MIRVTAYVGRMASCVFRITLPAVAVLALLSLSHSAPVLAQAPPPPAAAPADAAPAAPKLDAQQLDALTAPIAAYPDALLAQILMAATFPDDITAAAGWSKAHPDVKGDDAVKAVSSMPWDPSVQSLVAFPQALATMAQNPNWVEAIGQAFLAQSGDVMDSVQRLRQKAYQAGNLKTSTQQKVEVQPTTNTIVIQPANPQVVYVPTYNPTSFYGPWPYPTYPPTYLPPPPGYAVGTALATGLAFGAGIAITNSLWGGCDWGRHDVNVNVNRYNNINVNHRIDASRTTSNWNRTNSINNRDRMQASGRLGGANGRPAGGGVGDRNAYRGRDTAQRDQARQTLNQRTGQNMNASASERANTIRQGGGTRGTANRDDVKNRAQNVNRDNALRDAGNGRASKQSIERGQQSRGAEQARAGGSTRAAHQNTIGAGGSARAAAAGGGGAAHGGGGFGGRSGGGGGGGGGRGGGGGGHHRR